MDVNDVLIVPHFCPIPNVTCWTLTLLVVWRNEFHSCSLFRSSAMVSCREFCHALLNGFKKCCNANHGIRDCYAPQNLASLQSPLDSRHWCCCHWPDSKDSICKKGSASRTFSPSHLSLFASLLIIFGSAKCQLHCILIFTDKDAFVIGLEVPTG